MSQLCVHDASEPSTSLLQAFQTCYPKYDAVSDKVVSWPDSDCLKSLDVFEVSTMLFWILKLSVIAENFRCLNITNGDQFEPPALSSDTGNRMNFNKVCPFGRVKSKLHAQPIEICKQEGG